MVDQRVVPPVYYLDEGEAPSAIDVSNVGLGEGSPFTSPLAEAPVEILGAVGNYTILELVMLFVTYAFIIAAALAAVFIFIGGISFILSGGNDEKIKQAVNTIRYSIIGLIVTILSFTFVVIVGRIFNLNFLDYISYDQVKTSIDRVLSGGDSGDDPF
jgi:hypothetical protein